MHRCVVQLYSLCIYVSAHQHGGTEVKLVKELSDEDVHLYQSLLVSLLDLTDNVSEPFVLLLRTGDPDEEHLENSRDKIGGEFGTKYWCMYLDII